MWFKSFIVYDNLHVLDDGCHILQVKERSYFIIFFVSSDTTNHAKDNLEEWLQVNSEVRSILVCVQFNAFDHLLLQIYHFIICFFLTDKHDCITGSPWSSSKYLYIVNHSFIVSSKNSGKSTEFKEQNTLANDPIRVRLTLRELRSPLAIAFAISLQYFYKLKYARIPLLSLIILVQQL